VRADMANVVGERGRSGAWSRCSDNGHLKVWDKTPPEDWWSKERIKDRWLGGSKYPCDLKGPVCRFLTSNAGRPWDAVYSEVCRELRRGSLTRDRFLALIYRYVECSVILVDGIPCHVGGFQHGSPLRNHGGRYFYICPESGLLRRVPVRREAR
jgi:hypothetical protein